MLLLSAALMLLIIGFLHSYLGEKYLLIRLFKYELPKLLGGVWFTKQVLRFAWHLTTVAWFGFAVILICMHFERSSLDIVTLKITSAVFLLSGLMSFSFTKGKHFSYVGFWFVAAVCGYYAYTG